MSKHNLRSMSHDSARCLSAIISKRASAYAIVRDEFHCDFLKTCDFRLHKYLLLFENMTHISVVLVRQF